MLAEVMFITIVEFCMNKITKTDTYVESA